MGRAAIRPTQPGDLSHHRMTCEFPVRLTRDCSAWHGATRPIAVGEHRMTIAGDSGGRTLLVSRIRPAPDHNGHRFGTPSAQRHRHATQAIEALRDLLDPHGVEIQRVSPITEEGRVVAYIVELSCSAYDYLKRFTVLEHEHWLPQAASAR